MAKESGIGFSVAIDESDTNARTISNDITDLQFSTPRGVQDVTGLDSAGMERLLLLADFQATFGGVFNDASDMSHEVFKTVPSTSAQRTVTLGISGQSLAPECVLTDYQLSRAQDGSFRFSVPAMLANGSAPTWS